MKNLNIFFLCIFLCLFAFAPIHAQRSQGAMGFIGKDGRMHEIQSRGSLATNEYTVNLVPGIPFTGYWYFWLTSGSSISGDYSETVDVPWLSLSNSTFTSNSCSDVKYMSFHFEPTDVGTFSVTLTDAKGNYPDFIVNMIVEEEPEAGISPVNVERTTSLPSAALGNFFRYEPFSNLGCVPFAPQSTRFLQLKEYPEVEWLSLSVDTATIQLGDSVRAIYNLQADGPDTLRALVVIHQEWNSFPEYYLFTYSITFPVGIEDPLRAFGTFEPAYPSPATDRIYFPFVLEKSVTVSLRVFDLLGKELLHQDLGKLSRGRYRESINVEILPQGIYSYQFQVDGKKSIPAKFMVR